MRHVDDMIELAVATIMIVFMMTVGVWCIVSVRSLTATQVFEKTAPVIEVDQTYTIPDPDNPGAMIEVHDNQAKSAKDLLLMLVNADELCPPDASELQFVYKGKSWSVSINSQFFRSREDYINMAWNEFFKDCIDAKDSIWTPVFYENRSDLRGWHIEIVDEEVLA